MTQQRAAGLAVFDQAVLALIGANRLLQFRTDPSIRRCGKHAEFRQEVLDIPNQG